LCKYSLTGKEEYEELSKQAQYEHGRGNPDISTAPLPM
jgi:hypothetical protein